MEKFGIFELLDALSALTAREADPSAETGEAPPKTTDGAFAPPAYKNEPASAAPAPANAADPDALAHFLARHDAVAKKAEKKKS